MLVLSVAVTRRVVWEGRQVVSDGAVGRAGALRGKTRELVELWGDLLWEHVGRTSGKRGGRPC